MTRILIIFLLTTLFSCKKDPPVEGTKYSYFKNYFYNSYQDSSVTVLIYNVQLGFTSSQDPWDKNQIGATPNHIYDIAEIIRQVNPSIILLQEVPINRSNIKVKHFIEALADSLKMNFAYGGDGPNDPYGVWPVKGIWGNATLSKFPIMEIENIEVYNDSKWKRRSVLRAEIKFNDNLIINVYNLHHSGTDGNEMANTKKFIDASKFPIIAGGDFNRGYGNFELNLLSGLQDIFKNNINGIDRIYSSFNDTIFQTGTISGSNIVSDHWAYFAKVKLKPN
jgi:endonuclease/exonuclease/phosphatase family metal-dependent hydrolase